MGVIWKYILIFAVTAAIILGGRALFLKDDDSAKQMKVLNWEQPPKMEIDKSKKYFAEMVTSVGKIKVELFAKETPVAVNNFVFLSRQSFYDGLTFHRIIKDFMIQGGDPECKPNSLSGRCGAGGPGYRFDDEPITRDYNRGILAMANAGPNTNGSQFFIMHKDVPLPKNYVIFGQVVEGLDVLDKIAETPIGPSATGENSRPLKSVLIKSVTINEAD